MELDDHGEAMQPGSKYALMITIIDNSIASINVFLDYLFYGLFFSSILVF